MDIARLTDEELVEHIRDQDQESYREVVSRYQAKLMRYAVSLVGSEDVAKDIVQESFVKAFVNLNSFNNHFKFSSWIYRIAHNEAMNHFSKHKMEVPLDPLLDIAGQDDIEAEYETKEKQEEVRACLAEMPTIYAEPLILLYLEEKTYEEISDILRLPMGTVGTRISRGKILIKKLCQKKNQ